MNYCSFQFQMSKKERERFYIYIYIYIYILKTMKIESLLCFCATRFTAVAARQA